MVPVHSEPDEDRRYLLIRLPVHAKALVAAEVARLIEVIQGEMSRQDLLDALGLKHAEHFPKAYLLKALADGVLEMTIPDKPRSRLLRYRLTTRGEALRRELEAP